MTSKQKKAVLIFSSLLFICAVFVIYVRSADLLDNYIPTEGYYKNVTMLTLVGNYVLAAGALLCPIFAYILMKGIDSVPENRGPVFLFANAAFAFSLLTCSLSLLFTLLTSNANISINLLVCTGGGVIFSLLGCGFFVSNYF